MAVLVAISIPIFTSQLEKSREAVDEANLRSAYAECSASVLTGVASDSTVTVTDSKDVITATKEVTMKQTKAGWTAGTTVEIGGVTVAGTSKDGAGITYVVTVKDDGTATSIAEKAAAKTGE